MLDFLRKGDTLIVTRVDRLARSIKDLQDIVYALNQQGITLKATEQPVDTRTAAWVRRFWICWVSSLSLKPTCAVNASWGIAAAKARGVYQGRKPRIDPVEVRRLYVEEKAGRNGDFSPTGDRSSLGLSCAGPR